MNFKGILVFSNVFKWFQLAFGGAAPKTLNPGQNTQHTSQLKKISESFNGWPTNEPRGTCVCVCVCVCVWERKLFTCEMVCGCMLTICRKCLWNYSTLFLSLSLSHTQTHTPSKRYIIQFFIMTFNYCVLTLFYLVSLLHLLSSSTT